MQNPIAMAQNDVSREPVGDWKGSGTILVVDDEPMVRFVMTTVLSATGFEVLEAEDGQAGLELFQQHDRKIRAVLLDLSMPRMDGGEAFAEMQRWNPRVPIVLLSGHNERDSIDKLPAKGLAGFLAKPFKPYTLLEKVREVLETD